MIIFSPGDPVDEGPEVYPQVLNIDVSWNIEKEGKTETSNTISLDGLAISEQFGDLVWAVILADPSYLVTQSSRGVDAVNFYPQFPGSMTVQVQDLPSGKIPIGIKSCVVTPIVKDDRTGTTLGTPIALNDVEDFNWKILFLPCDIDPGGGPIDSKTRVLGFEWSLVLSSYDVNVFSVFLPSLNVFQGQKTNYFKLEVESETPDGGSVQITMEKCKLTNDLGGSIQKGAYSGLSFSGIGYGLIRNQSGIEFSIT